MKSQVATRFIECLNELKNRKIVKSNRQFALSLDYLPQSLSEIVKGRRNVPLSLLEKAVEKYSLNPYYLLTGEGKMLMNGKLGNIEDFEVLTVTQSLEREVMINFVPGNLQEVYCDELGDRQFMERLPKMYIPNLVDQRKLYSAFEIVDPQMAPSIHQGDIVVCKNIHHTNWAKRLGGRNVYVIVTKTGIFVRRVINRIIQETCLLLFTEGEQGVGHRLELNEVRQIWQVTALITHYFNSQGNRIKALEEQIALYKETQQAQRKQERITSR